MITFNNKETYLAYRSEWKSKYNELSTSLRNAKYCYWYNSLGQKRLDALPECEHDKYNLLSPWWGWSKWNIICGKKQATEMLAELKFAKQEAQRQYLAEKANKQLVNA